MSEPADRDLPNDLNAPNTRESGIVALRVLAITVALVTIAIGVVLASTVGLGPLPIIAWFLLVVPGVTLASLMIVDRFKRRG